MKKFLLSLLIAGFLNCAAGQNIVVPYVQKPVLTKRTAEWCINCGTWGWTMFEGLIEDNHPNALVIAAHYSGDLANQTATDITNNFGGFGQPTFFMDNENQLASVINYPTKLEEIKLKVTAAGGINPLAQTGIMAVYNDTELKVHTKTRFFEATSGAYYVGIYQVDKSVIFFQQGQGNDADHKNVLQASLLGDSFGTLVAEGAVAAETDFDLTATIDLSEVDDMDNLRFATIIWVKVDDKYEVVNSNFSDDISEEEVVATEDLERQVPEFTVTPNPADNQSDIQLRLETDLGQVELKLFDAKGQEVKVLFSGNLNAGSHNFEIERGPAISGGLYFIRLRAGNDVLSRKLIFK